MEVGAIFCSFIADATWLANAKSESERYDGKTNRSRRLRVDIILARESRAHNKQLNETYETLSYRWSREEKVREMLRCRSGQRFCYSTEIYVIIDRVAQFPLGSGSRGIIDSISSPLILGADISMIPGASQCFSTVRDSFRCAVLCCAGTSPTKSLARRRNLLDRWNIEVLTTTSDVMTLIHSIAGLRCAIVFDSVSSPLGFLARQHTLISLPCSPICMQLIPRDSSAECAASRFWQWKLFYRMNHPESVSSLRRARLLFVRVVTGCCEVHFARRLLFHYFSSAASDLGVPLISINLRIASGDKESGKVSKANVCWSHCRKSLQWQKLLRECRRREFALIQFGLADLSGRSRVEMPAAQ